MSRSCAQAPWGKRRRPSLYSPFVSMRPSGVPVTLCLVILPTRSPENLNFNLNLSTCALLTSVLAHSYHPSRAHFLSNQYSLIHYHRKHNHQPIPLHTPAPRNKQPNTLGVPALTAALPISPAALPLNFRACAPSPAVPGCRRRNQAARKTAASSAEGLTRKQYPPRPRNVAAPKRRQGVQSWYSGCAGFDSCAEGWGGDGCCWIVGRRGDGRRLRRALCGIAFDGVDFCG